MSLFAICYVLYAICYLLSIIKQAPAFSGGKFNLYAITSKNRITNIFASQRYKTNPVPSKQFPNFFPKKGLPPGFFSKKAGKSQFIRPFPGEPPNKEDILLFGWNLHINKFAGEDMG